MTTTPQATAALDSVRDRLAGVDLSGIDWPGLLLPVLAELLRALDRAGVGRSEVIDMAARYVEGAVEDAVRTNSDSRVVRRCAANIGDVARWTLAQQLSALLPE